MNSKSSKLKAQQMDDCEFCPRPFCSLTSLSVISGFNSSSQALSSPFTLPQSNIDSQHAYEYTCTHTRASLYLQPVWYLGQMCDSGLLVNEFPFIQVAELCSIKTNPEIGSKHPLRALERNKEKFFFQAFNQHDTGNIFFRIMFTAFYVVFYCESILKSLKNWICPQTIRKEKLSHCWAQQWCWLSFLKCLTYP